MIAMITNSRPAFSWNGRATVLAGLLAMAPLFTGCSKESSEEEPTVSVEAAKVQQGAIKETIMVNGVLFPLKQAMIAPKVAAPIAKFFVERGAKVHKGQLLAILENTDLKAAATENQGTFEQAEAEYASATNSTLPEEMQKTELDASAAKQALDAEQKLFDSRQKLFEEGALPRKDLDQARVSLTQARNQYELAERHLDAFRAGVQAQKLKAATGQLKAAQGKYEGSMAQLSYSEIRSPIDGVVTERPLYPGEMAAAGTPFITVMDLSEVIARIHIPQEQAYRMRVGSATIVEAHGLDTDFPGTVTLISPALDQNSTTVEVWIRVKNPSAQLKPGGTVEVSVISQQVTGATVVAAVSILTSPEGTSSVMLIADGKAQETPVELGIKNDTQVQITKGLKVGDLVVTNGAYGLPNGSKVKISEPESKAGNTDKASKSADE